VLGTFERPGEAVAVVRGRMVDEPIVRQAKRILQQSPQGRKKKK
jgi:citrate lyase beta subunit